MRWFGTTQGVTRYDGEAFSTLTLADGLPGEDRAALNGKVKALLSKGSANPAVLLETVKRLDSRRR